LSRERIALEAPAVSARVLAHGVASVEGALLERAFAAGREQGLAEGLAQAGDGLDRAAARLSALEEEARAALARTASELAVEIARVLLRVEIARENYDLEKLVRESLAESGVGRGACVVHLHPADHARLASVRFRSGTTLAPDEGVARGDVHVETPLGLLVRDVDGALEIIGRRLQEAVG